MSLKQSSTNWWAKPDSLMHYGRCIRLIQKIIGEFFYISILISLASCSIRPETPPENEPLPELPFARELQAALDHALRSSQGEQDLGISAALIVPGYQPWTGVSGNSHPGVPVTPEMLFDAGSVAKNFEAALVLKMVEEGRLDLDDPISRWLPAYPNVAGRITVRQLLDHTSGVFNVFEHPQFPWVGEQVDYSKVWRLEQVFVTFVNEPYGPPGYAQHYSSTNYLLLTAILQQEEVDIPAEIERRFLAPLGLQHTFISLGQPVPGCFVVAHPWVDVDRDGVLEDLYGKPFVWKVTLTHPVIFTTPEDLARWMQALYQERSVLSPGSLEQMLTFPDVRLRDPEGALYGLGVVDYSELLGMQVLGHGGSALGYSAAALYLPEYGASMTWCFNTGESPLELAEAIMGQTWSSLSEVLVANLAPAP